MEHGAATFKRGNESDVTCVLKWAAWEWLYSAAGCRSIGLEVGLEEPFISSEYGYRVDGGAGDVLQPERAQGQHELPPAPLLTRAGQVLQVTVVDQP